MTSGQVSPRSWQSWSSCCAYTLYTAASVSGNSQNASCLSWNLVTCRHAPPDLPVPEGLPTSLSALHPSLSVALLDLHAPGLLPRHLRSSLLTLPPQYPCCKEESKGREKGQNKILDATVQQMLVTSPFLQLGYWTTFESLSTTHQYWLRSQIFLIWWNWGSVFIPESKFSWLQRIMDLIQCVSSFSCQP